MKETQVLPRRPQWRRQSRVVFSGNGGGVVMVPGTYPGDCGELITEKTDQMDPTPRDTVANASCQAVRRVNAARYLKTCPSARFVAGEQI